MNATQQQRALEFCTCPRTKDGERRMARVYDRPSGAWKLEHERDPKCPLHGNNPERSPF